jgi:chromosomal replication initiation ATPase DnaA
LAKYIGNWSTKTIGRYYGGRDHSTVRYGIQRVEPLRHIDANVDTLVCDFRRHLL